MQVQEVVLEAAGSGGGAKPPALAAPHRKQHGVLCQVPGCGIDLSQSRLFHQRYHVCPAHCTADTVLMDGIMQRFCQQCGQFHDVERFSPGMRSCRAQLARHAERRRLRRAQAKAANEAQRGQQVAAQLRQQEAAGAGSGPNVPAPPGPMLDGGVASGAAAEGMMGGSVGVKRVHSPNAATAPPPAKAPTPSPLPQLLLPQQQQAQAQAQAQLASLPLPLPDSLLPLSQQQGSTASDHSTRSTHMALPPGSVDVLLLAAAAGVQAQAVMGGGDLQPTAAAPQHWAPQPGQWPAVNPGWPWAQHTWPVAPAAPPPMLWGAPPMPPPPVPSAPTDLLQLLLQQAASLQAPATATATALPALLPPPQSSVAPAGPPPPPGQLDVLVAAFQAAAEQHLRQQQMDVQVSALLARIAQQTPEQNAEQMQQLLSALVQPV